MQRYLRYSIIRKLPLLIIISVIFMTIAFVSASNVEFVRAQVDGEHVRYFSEDSGIASLIYTFFGTMLVLPFFSMNYRYSLAKSDTFRQAAFKDKSLRYLEHLSTLIIVLVSFTISFLIFVSLAAFRNYHVVYLPENTEQVTYYIAYFKYIYFLPLFFATFVLGICQYFISYFLISRSNNFLNSLMILTLGEAFLGCFIVIPMMLIAYNFSSISFGLEGATFIYPATYLYKQFNELILSGVNPLAEYFTLDPYNEVRMETVLFIMSGIVFLLLAGFSIFMFITEKDPSSEWANKPQAPNMYQEIIFHLGFLALGSVINMGLHATDSILSIIVYYVLFSSSYYTLYGLLNRNFKLKPYQIIILASVTLTTGVLAFAYWLRKAAELNYYF